MSMSATERRARLIQLKGDRTARELADVLSMPRRRIEAWLADPNNTDARVIPEDTMRLIEVIMTGEKP